MRIRRQIDATFSFGILTLFGLVTLSALAMWWGAFGALIAVACTAGNYAALSAASILFADPSSAPPKTRYCNWRLPPPDDGATLRVSATLYLVFHYACHLFWLTIMLPAGHPAIWNTPSLGPLTLGHVEHLVLAAFSLLLITSFFSQAYAGVPFSRRICIETSTLLTFLLATHFAIP